MSKEIDKVELIQEIEKRINSLNLEIREAKENNNKDLVDGNIYARSELRSLLSWINNK